MKRQLLQFDNNDQVTFNKEQNVAKKSRLLVKQYYMEGIVETMLETNSISKKEYNQLLALKVQYHVKNKKQLLDIIEILLTSVDFNCNLNWLDISGITDLSSLFRGNVFNGDISEWNVRNVTNMSLMFYDSRFEGDISNWDVSHVKDMHGMFEGSFFNGDISNWDVGNVTDMSCMFRVAMFNQNIANWDVSNVENLSGMFANSNFNKDISIWSTILKPKVKAENMFFKCDIKEKYKPKFN